MTAGYAAPTVAEVRTSVPEVAHAALVEGYSPTRPVRFSGVYENFEFATSAVTAGPLTTATIRHSAATVALTEPYEPFISGFARSGQLNFKTKREDVLVDRQHVVRYSTDLPIAVSWDDVDLLVVMFPMAVIAEAASRFTDKSGGFRFISTAPASLPLSRFWRSTMSHVDHELRADASALGYPLVQAETVGLLAAAALTVFPNTTTTLDYLPGPGVVAPIVVRRAMAFIDANAQLPITVGEIAAAAGIGVRGLQQAFVRHTGRPPMGYTRRVRLERAHQELLAADATSGVTVKAVAARWGFGRPDRFSALYREAFGLLPSQSLRK